MNLLNDLTLSFRSWLKTPVVFILAILMLAVGIGASVAACGFLNAALLQPLAVKKPEEIMRIWNPLFSIGTMSAGHSYELMEYSSTFSDSYIFRTHGGINFQLEDNAVLVTAAEVSGNYFEVLGVGAKIGRTIIPEDDIAGADPVVMISERLWRHEFASREDIIGSLIRLNSRPATVVGILPAAFTGTARTVDYDVWFPHHQTFEQGEILSRGYFPNTLQFRLRDGVSATQVQAELDAFVEYLHRDAKERNPQYALQLKPEREVFLERRKDLAIQSFLIQGVLLILLLIACANVSNILLAKVNARRSELAVRRALGAPARSIFGLLMADGLVIAVLAGATGLVFTFLFIRAFSLLGMEIPPGEALNAGVLFFFLAVTFAVGFLCALLPAIQAMRVDINEVLKESSRTATRFRTGRVLIIIQVALSLTLLIGSGLFMRSLQQAQRMEPGHRIENVLTFSVNLANLGEYDSDQRTAYFRAVMETVEKRPEVISAGISNFPPFRGYLSSTASLWTSGVDFSEQSDYLTSHYFALGPGFLETLDIPLLAGRSVTMEDIESGEQVAVVNETFANRYWPGEDPIGREFIPSGGSTNTEAMRRVIGVARDFRPGVRERTPSLFMYSAAENRVVVVIRTRLDPGGVKQGILKAIQEIEPSLPVQDFRTIGESLALAVQPIRAGFTIMLTVGLLGLAISVIGIYAALSYWVRRSTQEIGLRMALGAAPLAIVSMYVRRGGLIVFGGLFLGVGLAVFAMPHVQDLFYEVSPWDPVTFVAVPIVLFIAALLACYFSARHAARVDPMVALRRE